MLRYDRRQFLEMAATAGAGAVAAACNLDIAQPRNFTHADALIAARPVAPTIVPTVGYTELGLATSRDGFLYVPTTYQAATAAPLLLLLHPNGSSAAAWEAYQIGEMLDDLGVVIVAPDSRGPTWDIIGERGYASDPAYFNLALTHTFNRCNINPARIAIAGFSDGGLESLGVGIANGSLFTHIIAYSPSRLIAPWAQGMPRIYITHGESDAVLPFAYTRDQIAQRLMDATYDVTFVPFDGGHIVPTTVARQSVEWFLA